jgi:hypothetical protein
MTSTVVAASPGTILEEGGAEYPIIAWEISTLEGEPPTPITLSGPQSVLVGGEQAIRFADGNRHLMFSRVEE